MIVTLVSALLGAAPLPSECEQPPPRDTTALQRFAQQSGSLSASLDAVATWCFSAEGQWNGGQPSAKKPPKEPLGDCARAVQGCEGAKGQLSQDSRALLYSVLDELARPYLGQVYVPKRSGLLDRPSEAADCWAKSRADLFAQAQARMDLARLASQAHAEYQQYRTWLFSEGMRCARQVHQGRADASFRLTVAADVVAPGTPSAGIVDGGAGPGVRVVQVALAPTPTGQGMFVLPAPAASPPANSASPSPVVQPSGALPAAPNAAGNAGAQAARPGALSADTASSASVTPPAGAAAPTSGGAQPSRPGAPSAPGTTSPVGAAAPSVPMYGGAQPAQPGAAPGGNVPAAGATPPAGPGVPSPAGVQPTQLGGGTVPPSSPGSAAAPQYTGVPPAQPGAAPAAAPTLPSGPSAPSSAGAQPGLPGSPAAPSYATPQPGSPASASSAVPPRPSTGAAPTSPGAQPTRAGVLPAGGVPGGGATPSSVSPSPAATSPSAVAPTGAAGAALPPARAGAVVPASQPALPSAGGAAAGPAASVAGVDPSAAPSAPGRSVAVPGSTGPQLVAPTGSGVLPRGAQPTLDPGLALLLPKWRRFAEQRTRLEMDRDYVAGFLPSRELRECRCGRTNPAAIVLQLEQGAATAALLGDDLKATRCEQCLNDAFVTWRRRVDGQCGLMDQLTDHELAVLERSDDGNGLPARCFEAARAKRGGFDAGALAVAGAAPAAPVSAPQAPAPLSAPASAQPGAPAAALKQAPPGAAPAVDNFTRPHDYAPVPLREDGRLYVRLFMSSACVAELWPGPLQARTGDLLLIPFGAPTMSVTGPCGGLAEVYWGREVTPRVSELFGRNQTLTLQFRPQ